MAEIWIRFVTDPCFISRAIRTITWSGFSHVEFMLNSEMILGCFGDTGVSIRSYYPCPVEEIYSIPCTEEQQQNVFKQALSQLGKPYDYSDILGILLHRDWRSVDRWICSEHLTWAFETGGLPLLNVPGNCVNRITPRDVSLSPLLIGRRINAPTK